MYIHGCSIDSAGVCHGTDGGGVMSSILAHRVTVDERHLNFVIMARGETPLAKKYDDLLSDIYTSMGWK